MIKFREHITKNKTLILAGRNAKNNEESISQAELDEEMFHTAAIGSPFVNIKGKAKKEDIKEAAILCARYSKDWRDNKLDVIVHQFKGKDIYKRKNMKLGTFGIKNFKIIKVKKQDIEKWPY